MPADPVPDCYGSATNREILQDCLMPGHRTYSLDEAVKGRLARRAPRSLRLLDAQLDRMAAIDGAQIANEPSWIANDQCEGRHIVDDHGAGADQAPWADRSNGIAADDRRIRSYARTFAEDCLTELPIAFALQRTVWIHRGGFEIVGRDAMWAHKDTVLEADAAIERYAVLDLAAIADQNARIDEHVLADGAVATDPGAGPDLDVDPDLRARADQNSRIDQPTRAGMNESGFLSRPHPSIVGSPGSRREHDPRYTGPRRRRARKRAQEIASVAITPARVASAPRERLHHD